MVQQHEESEVKKLKMRPLRSPAGHRTAFLQTLHDSLITLFSHQLAKISHVQLTCRIRDKVDFECVKHFHLKFHTMAQYLPVLLLPSRVMTLTQMFPGVLQL